ncbi:hypothetical protein Tco_0130183, partial [Tanacetum coccineum]
MPTDMELTLEQTQQGVSYEVSVNTYAVRNTQVLSDIEDSHGPNDAMHNPLPATQIDIEKVALSSSLRSLKSKCTIESRAKKRSSM